MDQPSRPKTVLDHVKPTVVRRRIVSDASVVADEPPPSSIFPHPDYNLHEDDEEAKDQ